MTVQSRQPSGNGRKQMMPDITDHAVLRFLERVKGINIQAIRSEMRSAALDAISSIGGTATIKMPCGARMRVVNGTVVTVAPKKLAKKCRVGRREDA